MIAAARTVVRRDLLLAMRRRGDVAVALLFFVIVASLFPLGVGAEPNLLRAVAPGVIWVAALLSSMLSLARLFAADHADGTLEQMLLGAAPQGSRQQAIWNVANGYGKVLGAVLAHEIGHSLGLNHSSPSGGSGDIMNASLFVSQSANYAFNSTHWGILLNNLPGPNRD